MHITIDGRALVGNRTGIGVHTAEIARRQRDAPLIASHAAIDDRSGLEHCTFRVDPMPFGVAWQQPVLPPIPTAAVPWGPNATRPPGLRIPSVPTLHNFS